MTCCAVQNCRNYSKKTSSGVTCYRFPNDLVTRKNWIFACKKKKRFSKRIRQNKRLKNRTVKRKLVSDLTETRERKRHPENSKCEEENKNNGTRVATQELNEQTMCRPCPNIFTQKKNNRKADLKKNQRIWLDDDDIAATETLRSSSSSSSRKAYLYLRKNVGLPLPGLSTIRKWTRNLEYLPGIQKELLPVLKGRSVSMSSRERLAVLSFDDMRVDTRIIMGPHSPFQRPGYNIIKEVEDSGFKVVAIVSDMGGKILSLWKNLQISTNEVSCTNPVDVTLKIRVFADMPHLIKLLRNNFLEYGIRLPCGSKVSKWQLQKILHDKDISLNS
ncbi:hypothetical protein PR048_018844 [Dryococelus australis]|uniref:Transposase n=1 Tax=Dryococelus australis TaxID=614101 RepID=A0ABQ9H1U3_9NEOP|nr:hypothetical protein PR048_018844 [Dryococelus australis]